MITQPLTPEWKEIVAVQSTADAFWLWEISRSINQVLGFFVVSAILWRCIPMLVSRQRWADVRARHLMLWFLLISASILNATLAALNGAGPPTYNSFVRLMLNLAAAGLCAWWPHPRGIQYGGPE